MKRPMLVALALSFLALAAYPQAAIYNVVMTGPQEGPPNTTTGSGSAIVTLDSNHTTLTLTAAVSGLTGAITNSHIHGELLDRTQSAGVKIAIPVPSWSNGHVTMTVPVDKNTLGDPIFAHPERYYVNVHTAQFPNGEIRGFLIPKAVPQEDSSGTVTYAGELRGSTEVPTTTSTAVGSYFFTLDANNDLTYEINAVGLVSPTLAHIHGPLASGSQIASPIITFAGSSAQFTGNRLHGKINVGTLSSDNLNALRTQLDKFYVNVHTTANPGGEIRGPLTFAREYDVPAVGKVSNGLSQNFVTDLRIFNSSFTKNTAALLEYFSSSLSANDNATTSFVVDIPPRGTASLNDVNGAAALNTTGTGGLRVSSSGSLAVTSRIFNDQRASGKGTFGQFVPASARSALLAHGALTQLTNSSDLTTGARTNIGFFNPNTSDVLVHLELRDDQGALLKTNSLTVSAQSQQQNAIGVYFPGLDVSNRPFLTVTFDATQPIITYASVVDNVSSDPIFVGPEEDDGIAPPATTSTP